MKRGPRLIDRALILNTVPWSTGDAFHAFTTLFCRHSRHRFYYFGKLCSCLETSQSINLFRVFLLLFPWLWERLLKLRKRIVIWQVSVFAADECVLSYIYIYQDSLASYYQSIVSSKSLVFISGLLLFLVLVERETESFQWPHDLDDEICVLSFCVWRNVLLKECKTLEKTLKA